MTPEYLEKLIAMLNPQCDDDTVKYVIGEISENIEYSIPPRSDQQRVDVYDSTLANDPLKW